MYAGGAARSPGGAEPYDTRRSRSAADKPVGSVRYPIGLDNGAGAVSDDAVLVIAVWAPRSDPDFLQQSDALSFIGQR